jgi:vacuole morphology and inheritance protein 14
MKRHVDCADVRSAELEMTVNMLIQIDKLVQLLESPVFTCKILF